MNTLSIESTTAFQQCFKFEKRQEQAHLKVVKYSGPDKYTIATIFLGIHHKNDAFKGLSLWTLKINGQKICYPDQRPFKSYGSIKYTFTPIQWNLLEVEEKDCDGTKSTVWIDIAKKQVLQNLNDYPNRQVQQLIPILEKFREKCPGITKVVYQNKLGLFAFCFKEDPSQTEIYFLGTKTKAFIKLETKLLCEAKNHNVPHLWAVQYPQDVNTHQIVLYPQKNVQSQGSQERFDEYPLKDFTWKKPYFELKAAFEEEKLADQFPVKLRPLIENFKKTQSNLSRAFYHEKWGTFLYCQGNDPFEDQFYHYHHYSEEGYLLESQLKGESRGFNKVHLWTVKLNDGNDHQLKFARMSGAIPGQIEPSPCLDGEELVEYQ